MAPAITPGVTAKRKALVTGTKMTLDNLIRLKKSKQELMDMNQTNPDLGKPSYWQLVFLQSKVNGARYIGDDLPGRTWQWPKDTYLQRRLQGARWYHSPDNSKLN